MKIHILGICGTFMGSLAQLAKAAGHQVSGCDANVYPPMSSQLEQAGIVLTEGYDPGQLQPVPDLVVVGNALSRGNPCVEYLLDHNIPFTSGPQWLGEHILRPSPERAKWVLAVAGTHGKTTTASMLAWILDCAGLAPGFLIGGVPKNFGCSARLGESPFFVVEADEYDTAFFDKRSKFVHYGPRTLVINNLEYDHADIFPDLAAIQTQFHHLIRTVPGQGRVIVPAADGAIASVVEQGCWTPVETLGEGGLWQALPEAADGSRFSVQLEGNSVGRVNWEHTGRHNMANALAAIAAARHAGVQPATACDALSRFAGVKRRMETLAKIGGISVYDDFAHHPTAIATTLEGLRKKVGSERIIAIIEPRSNTMKRGIHNAELGAATGAADAALWYQPDTLDWSLENVIGGAGRHSRVVDNIAQLLDCTLREAGDRCHVVIMSNGGFEGFHNRLIQALREREHV